MFFSSPNRLSDIISSTFEFKRDNKLTNIRSSTCRKCKGSMECIFSFQLCREWSVTQFCFFVPHRSRMEAKGPRANGAVPPQKLLFRKKFSKCPHRFFARCPVFSSSKMQLTIVFQTEKLTSEHDFWELFQTICLKIIFKHYFLYLYFHLNMYLVLIFYLMVGKPY